MMFDQCSMGREEEKGGRSARGVDHGQADGLYTKARYRTCKAVLIHEAAHQNKAHTRGFGPNQSHG